ncbi:MAG: hypothetical protein PGN13_04845 [Patulibacter minatonensis]
MRSNLNVVGERDLTPRLDQHGRPATILVVSRERVGRVFVIQALREHGLLTVVSDTAGQAVRRIAGDQGRIAAIFIVGDLADGTAESYQRWLRTNGHATMPLIAIGAELEEQDPFGRAIDPRDWLVDAAGHLLDLQLVTRELAEIAVA